MPALPGPEIPVAGISGMNLRPSLNSDQHRGHCSRGTGLPKGPIAAEEHTLHTRGSTMSDYRETKTVFEQGPIRRARPVVESQYDSVVVREKRGLSGGEVAALMLAAIAVGVVIVMLILNIQQKNRDEELAQERARLSAEQANAQPSQQPPVIVMPPQSQPGIAPVPVPVPTPAPSSATTPTSTELEVAIGSKLLDDQELRPHSVVVQVSGGVAMLSGSVPSDDLKTRAEDLAKSVQGIRSVVNAIVVKPVMKP